MLKTLNSTYFLNSYKFQYMHISLWNSLFFISLNLYIDVSVNLIPCHPPQWSNCGRLVGNYSNLRPSWYSTEHNAKERKDSPNFFFFFFLNIKKNLTFSLYSAPDILLNASNNCVFIGVARSSKLKIGGWIILVNILCLKWITLGLGVLIKDVKR